VSEPGPETREELVQQLEQLTGRVLKTRADIRAYVREAATRNAADHPSVRRWLRVKKGTLIALLAFGVIQYYVLDVMLQIAALPNNTYFVPVKTPLLKS
jgi:hypothetical protein